MATIYVISPLAIGHLASEKYRLRLSRRFKYLGFVDRQNPAVETGFSGGLDSGWVFRRLACFALDAATANFPFASSVFVVRSEITGKKTGKTTAETRY